jgi:twinkle protein
MGIQHIVVDNLTAIELPKGQGSKVEAIDEAMKRMGTFKDEKPVTLYIISHLKRPQNERIPHEKGGEVFITDFRGAGSITFWANGVFGIERNTTGETVEEQRMTTFRCVKSRDNGLAPGKLVYAHMNPKTGRLLENSAHKPAMQDDTTDTEGLPAPKNEEF